MVAFITLENTLTTTDRKTVLILENFNLFSDFDVGGLIRKNLLKSLNHKNKYGFEKVYC